jgi:phosphoribosylformylglycinamidine synthase
VGFSVSNLRIPGFEQPWEQDFGKPSRIVSAFDIMQEGRLAAPPSTTSSVALPSWLLPYLRRAGAEPQWRRGARLPQAHHAGRRLGNIRSEHVQKGEIPWGRPSSCWAARP